MPTPNGRAIPLILGGVRHEMLFDFDAFCSIEDLTGKCFMEPVHWRGMSAAELRAVLFGVTRSACRAAGRPAMSLQEVGQTFLFSHVPIVALVIRAAFAAAMPRSEDAGEMEGREEGDADELEAQHTPIDLLQLYSTATVVLGVTDEQWRRMTPRVFMALWEAHKVVQKRQDIRAGVIAAEVRNTLRGKREDKVWTAMDFFPEPKKPQTEEKLIRWLKMWAAATQRSKGVEG